MLNNSDTLKALNASKNSMESLNIVPKKGSKAPVVMVVDDDDDSLVLMCHVLEQFACEPLCETNGQAALNLIHKYVPDLILLDIRLPELSGLDIIRSLRCHKATHTIPIIVITAMAGYKDREEGLCVGCDHYVTKPYMLEDIESIIGNYLPEFRPKDNCRAESKTY